jgi:hypothetical protein
MRHFLLLLFLTIFSYGLQAQNPKFLVLDRYTTKRIKLYEGDAIWVKLKGEDFKMKDYIKQLKDSTLVLGKRDQEIPLNDIEAFYFHRTGWQMLSGGLGYIGAGFVFSAAVHPLIRDAQYDQKEAATIGLTALALSQVVKLFHRKKYHIGPNTRVRIIEVRFDQVEQEDK